MAVENYEQRFALKPELRGGNPRSFSLRIGSITVQGGAPVPLATAGVSIIVGGNNAGKSTLLRQMYGSITGPWQAKVVDQPYLLMTQKILLEGSRADAHAWFASDSYAIDDGYMRRGVKVSLSQLDLAYQVSPTAHLMNFAASMTLAPNARTRFDAIRAVKRRGDISDPPHLDLHYLEEETDLFRSLNSYTKEIFGTGITLDWMSGNLILRFGESTVTPDFEDLRPYRKDMARLPSVESQGDGIGSTLGLLVPLIAGRNEISFVDEPEAFLHPPQAFKLGRIVAEITAAQQSQLIVATHDRNFVAGVLSSQNVERSVIRLDRSGNSTTAHRVDPAQLNKAWASPLLRHSNVLDGLFHRAVVIAEGERDCLFYAAALEEAAPLPDGLLPNDVLLLSSHGKGGATEIASILTAARVPVLAALDIDALKEKSTLKALVQALAGTWTAEIDSDFDKATNEFRRPRQATTNGSVQMAITGVLNADPGALYSGSTRQAVARALAVDDPWAEVKRYGTDGFRADRPAADRLLAGLRLQGVVLVPVGELERFAPSLGVRKGPEWLPAALAANAHTAATASLFAHQLADAIVAREKAHI
jgi:hypothetical protein